MPPWPWDSTAGALATGVFSPAGVTSQTGPTFSVTIMRPSGRKAMRQGRLNVATLVMAKGTVASGFCAPILTCACAAVPASAAKTIPIANFILTSPEPIVLALWRPTI